MLLFFIRSAMSDWTSMLLYYKLEASDHLYGAYKAMQAAGEEIPQDVELFIQQEVLHLIEPRP